MSRFDNHEILEGRIVTATVEAALATAYINRKAGEHAADILAALGLEATG